MEPKFRRRRENLALIGELHIPAGNRCDDCQVPAAFDPLPFHVDHIIARQRLVPLFHPRR